MSTLDYWDLIAPHWESLVIDDGPEVFLASYRALPQQVRHLLCAHWVQSEVCNGGFQQFFLNSTGVLGPEAIAGLEAVGMPQTAGTLRQAMALFGPTYPRDREVRIAALEADSASAALLPSLAELDDAFYRLLESENAGWDEAATRFANNAG
ncbi:MAG: DUF4375 domain-containing protein [Gemmatimonadetes bacterium]|nr:DUF4375 domain-containing protein [Gemmatimonadota bacterium]